jgi:DNA-binding beta-propeller fold protein YncE
MFRRLAPHKEPFMSSERFCSFRTVRVFALFFLLASGIGFRCLPKGVEAAAAPAPGPSGYHLLKTIKVGGDGFWDYLAFDSATRRLFISRGTKVVVLDVDSGKVVGEIPNTAGVHGIALAPDLGRGFTSNGQAGTITIFDLKTLQVIGEAKAEMNPDAIVYDPSSKRAFAMNGRSGSATAIDGATGNVAGTIAIGGKLEFAVADGAGHVYVNVENKGEEVEIDSKNLTVMAHWPLAPCAEPSGLAIDAKNRRLFAGCGNKMMAVIDADSGKVIATPAIGAGVDANQFDPGTALAFASCGAGVLSVVHEDSTSQFSPVEDVPTQQGARTMALDLKTHEVYLVTAQFAPPPAPTADNPHPRPSLVPDSFVVLVFGR